jgi:hypothetical protein
MTRELIYKSQDDSLEFKFQFIVKRNLRYTHLGKSWPKHTQCLMFCNGLLNCFETIIKHEKDEDNQVYAYKLVAEKCITKSYYNSFKHELLSFISDNIEKLN